MDFKLCLATACLPALKLNAVHRLMVAPAKVSATVAAVWEMWHPAFLQHRGPHSMAQVTSSHHAR